MNEKRIDNLIKRVEFLIEYVKNKERLNNETINK